MVVRRTRTLIFILILSTGIILYININNLPTLDNLQRVNASARMLQPPKPKEVVNKTYSISNPGCKIPYLDPYHPSLQFYLKNFSKFEFKCDYPQLFVMQYGYLKFQRTVSQDAYKWRNVKYNWKTLNCEYTPIFRRDDNELDYDITIPIIQHETTIVDEFIVVECFRRNISIYQDFFATVLRKPEVERRCKKRRKIHAPALSVLLLGLGSVSKSQYRRHLPKTDDFIRNELDAIEFDGFNTVSFDNFHNIMGISSGNSSSRGKNLYKTLNSLSMIWNVFAMRGYRTLYAEDTRQTGTFANLTKGFDEQPTDYYYRPLSVAVENSTMRKKVNSNCFPNRTESSVVLKWMTDFFDEFAGNPTFAYVFLSRISTEDFNSVAHLDTSIRNALEDLYDMQHLENTIVFFFSDHGFTGGVSNTYYGHLEEKLPFFFMIIPPRFAERFPTYHDRFQSNSQKLVTVLDIHATLVDISNFLLTVRSFTKNNQSASLFSPISNRRNCRSANIDVIHCSCLGATNLKKESYTGKRAAKALVDYMNNALVNYRELCKELSLLHVVKLRGGYELTGRDEVSFGTYINITIRVAPNDGIYSATMFYDRQNICLLLSLNRNLTTLVLLSIVI